MGKSLVRMGRDSAISVLQTIQKATETSSARSRSRSRRRSCSPCPGRRRPELRRDEAAEVGSVRKSHLLYSHRLDGIATLAYESSNSGTSSTTAASAGDLEMGTVSTSARSLASNSAQDDYRRGLSAREQQELEARDAHMLKRKFRGLSISHAGSHGEERRSRSAPMPARPVAAQASSRSRSQVPVRRSLRNQPCSSRPMPDRHSREQRMFSEQTARARQWPGDQGSEDVEKKCLRRMCNRLQIPENDGYCHADCRVRCLECDRPCTVFGQMCKYHVHKCASPHCNERADYDGRYCGTCFFRPKCLAFGCQKPNAPGYLGYCEGHVECGKVGCANVGLGSFNGCCSNGCMLASPPCAYHSCQWRGPGHKLRDGCCSSACQSALRR